MRKLTTLVLISFLLSSCKSQLSPVEHKGDMFYGSSIYFNKQISKNPSSLDNGNNPFLYSMLAQKTEEHIWPVEDSIKESIYGYSNGTDWVDQSCDDGIVITAPSDTPIMAFGHGSIRHVGYNVSQQHGNIITMRSNNINAIYSNVGKILTKNGNLVAPGDIIAKFGNDGNNTSKICFSLIKKDININPRDIIPKAPLE